MIRFVLSRCGQAVAVLWAAYTVTFLVLYVLPGDPVLIMLNAAGVQASTLAPADLAAIKAKFGLDQPLYLHYLTSLGGALRGDFGISIAQNQPVTSLLASRLPGTLALAGSAVIVSLVLGVAFAYVVSGVRTRWLRTALNRLPVLGVSMPTFWVGLLLLQVFAFGLGWIPATSSSEPITLVLPVITMAIPSAAIYAQVLGRGFDEGLRQPYAQTALSRGMTLRQVQRRYIFRNAALPVLTLLGLQVGTTAAGAIVIETVFTRTGIGRLTQEAVLSQDIPVVLAVVVLAATAFVTVNLVIDLVYPLIDPRVRVTSAARSTEPRSPEPVTI